MAYSSAEVKAGALITTAFALLLGLTFSIGHFMGGSTQTLQVQFGYISGLKKNAPVYFAGHETGKVDRIEILKANDRPVLVTVRIPADIVLHEDTQSYIDTLGLMGEKFVELTPGSGQSPELKKGVTIQGTDPIPMYMLVQKMNLLAGRMDEMTATLNPMLGHVDKMFAGHEQDISDMISNLHATSANIREMTDELKKHPWRLVRKG